MLLCALRWNKVRGFINNRNTVLALKLNSLSSSVDEKCGQVGGWTPPLCALASCITYAENVNNRPTVDEREKHFSTVGIILGFVTVKILFEI